MKPILTVRPVTRYSEPAYPLRKRFLSTPDVLSRGMPRRWIRGGLAAAAAALGVAAGCMADRGDKQSSSKPAASTDRIEPGDIAATTPSLSATGTDPSPMDSSIVAPVFDHGPGRGAWGCIAVSPPVFMAESEAREIIEDELAKYGLKFSPDAYAIDEFLIPGIFDCEEERRWMGDPVDEEDLTPKIQAMYDKRITLTFDGFDPAVFVAYEFVGEGDHDTVKSENGGSLGSAWPVFVRKDAERLVELLKNRNVPAIGVFYDPLPVFDWESFLEKEEVVKSFDDFDMIEDEKVAEQKRDAYIQGVYEQEALKSRNLLRAQAHDFGEWLVARGIVPPPENPDAPESDEELDP